MESPSTMLLPEQLALVCLALVCLVLVLVVCLALGQVRLLQL